MRRLQIGLTAMIVSILASFSGYTAYSFWHYLTYPEVHLAESAPWYTGVILYGAIALLTIIICTLLKLILRRAAR